MSPAFTGASMMFHIGLEMDAASGSATHRMAATLRSLLLTQITIESPKSRGMKGGKDKGNYSIFFENCTWFLCLSRLLWDGPIKNKAPPPRSAYLHIRLKMSARWNTSMRTRHVPILSTQEVLAISKEHVLDTSLEKKRVHRLLWQAPFHRHQL
jgi:hypothetical protein